MLSAGHGCGSKEAGKLACLTPRPSYIFRSTASPFLLSSGFCFGERGGEVVIVELLPSSSARQKQEEKRSPSTRRNCARVAFCRSDQVDFL